ncbi:Zim17-type zinc finger protein [Corchorus capsularis]|uniref:Zim17-type zinc finger protein n=1 Tax=Corchorus capsularis TaxID=210143 RepID=A0A1R3JLH6_COCAP|nr:Zim17-type zinc finger protein [Corchorus capsularis]
MSQFRRLLSLLAPNQPQTSLLKERYSQVLPSTSAFFSSRRDFCRRWLQTEANPTGQAIEDRENHDADSSKSASDLVNAPRSKTNHSALKNSAFSNLKISPRHDLAMVFTCKVCETRSVKTASRESYEKGVVVARCGGCNNLHLIADRLGWFGEPGSIEDFLSARGEEVKKGSVDTLNLTLEDLAGKGALKGSE